jgi:hypothetical protein
MHIHRTEPERLAALETHMVAVLSTLSDMRTTQLEIRETQIADKASAKATKAVVAKIAGVVGTAGGVVGSLITWMMSHGWIKVPVAVTGLAITLHATPAHAILSAREPTEDPGFVSAWIFEAKACRAAVCVRKLEREVESRSACELLSERVLAGVRDTTPAFWGFEDGKPVEIRVECREEYGDNIPA